ncbi:MAG: UDP-2,3-diacylglucosamine diphosphatase LpxI [Candidatus Omnitrophota bacterium]
MGKIGLVAGKGVLPLEFIRSAREKGDKVVVFAIQKMASPELDKTADRVYWLDVGQYKKFVFLLLKEMIRKLAFAGKIEKNLIYSKESYDEKGKGLLEGLKDKKDTSIFEELTKRLRLMGVEVIEETRYLSHLLPKKGVISNTVPDDRVKADISFGYNTAKKLADMDIGQTVVVKDRSVVAVEAMEGTDAAILRAKELAGDGCVMVKVSRPGQDMRWDVPVVGPKTMAMLIENGFSAMAIESGKMFLIEKEKILKMADEAKIAVEVL